MDVRNICYNIAEAKFLFQTCQFGSFFKSLNSKIISRKWMVFKETGTLSIDSKNRRDLCYLLFFNSNLKNEIKNNL